MNALYSMQVRDMAAKMLNQKLITKQTGAAGRICNTVQVPVLQPPKITVQVLELKSNLEVWKLKSLALVQH